ncbi:MAG: hypothetical protein O3B72_08650 [Proteobacteria bacterium]|nr:hypothetical protein [Pseudomonadota bacterium]
MRWCLFIMIMLLTTQAGGAEGQGASGNDSSEPETSVPEAAPSSPESAEAETQSGAATGSLRSLRSKEISEAFRDFQPSEEISADNAVKFPVDI